MERSTLAKFGAYQLNSLNGKLNGSRKENMHRSICNEYAQSNWIRRVGL